MEELITFIQTSQTLLWGLFIGAMVITKLLFSGHEKHPVIESVLFHIWIMSLAGLIANSLLPEPPPEVLCWEK